MVWSKPAYIQHYPGRQRCSKRSQTDHHFLAARQSRNTPRSMSATDFFQGYGSLEDSLDRGLGNNKTKKRRFYLSCKMKEKIMLFIQSFPPLFLDTLVSPNTDDLEGRVATSSEQELSPVEKGKELPARRTYPWSTACAVTAKLSHIYSPETLLQNKFALFIIKSFPMKISSQKQTNPGFFCFVSEEKSWNRAWPIW